MIRFLTIIYVSIIPVSAVALNLDSNFLTSTEVSALKCRDPYPSRECINSLITQNDFLLAGELNCKNNLKDPYYFFCLCKKFRSKKLYDRAMENCQKALSMDPVNENIHIEMGIINLQYKKNQKAIENFSVALASDPKNKKAAYLYALSNERLKNYSEALKTLKGIKSSIKRNEFSKKKIEALERKILELEKLKRTREKENAFKKTLICHKNYLNISSQSDEERYNKGKECLSLGLSDESFLLSYAKICSRIGKYEEAKQILSKAKKNITPMKYKLQWLLISADLNLKFSNKESALNDLKGAIGLGLDDPFWLRKYSQLAEDLGDYKAALEAISSIKEKENIDISRIEYLKDRALTDEEIIRDLIKRQVITEGTSFLNPYEKKLFFSMREVERNGACDYIRKKYMGYAELLIETLEGKDFTYKLTLKGFNLYMRDISQKAVRFFEKKGIPLNEVFALRTLKGENYFDKTGKLTDEGLSAYLSCLIDENSKNWLRSYEEVPASDRSDDSAETNQEIQALLSRGYMEVSQSEYQWLMHETDCPESVLMSAPCDMKSIKVKDRLRYFSCYKEGICSKEAMMISIYVLNYRNGNAKEIAQKSTHRGFFGSGPDVKRKFCYKNKLWNGID